VLLDDPTDYEETRSNGFDISQLERPAVIYWIGCDQEREQPRLPSFEPVEIKVVHLAQGIVESKSGLWEEYAHKAQMKKCTARN